MTDADDLKRRLTEAGKRREEADAAHDAAMRDIGAAMREGKERGLLDIKTMSELAGVTRQTAYRLL